MERLGPHGVAEHMPGESRLPASEGDGVASKLRIISADGVLVVDELPDGRELSLLGLRRDDSAKPVSCLLPCPGNRIRFGISGRRRVGKVLPNEAGPFRPRRRLFEVFRRQTIKTMQELCSKVGESGVSDV